MNRLHYRKKIINPLPNEYLKAPPFGGAFLFSAEHSKNQTLNLIRGEKLKSVS